MECLRVAGAAPMDGWRYDGRRLLHLAADNGHVEVVKVLIEAGANIHAKDRDGQTPRARALQKGHFDVTGILKEKEASNQLG